jgi:predicted MFS family arabinose efflux permease
LIDAVGWRAIFFVNLPVAAAAFLFALRIPPDHGPEADEPLDTQGAVLTVLALGLFSYGLVALGEARAPAGALALAVAVAASWFLIRTEARSRAPMMPLSLFHDRNFSGANGLTLLLYAALTGALFLVPFMLIEAHGYTATAAGAAFLPFSAIMGVGSRRSGGLVERTGARAPLVVGPSIVALGFALLGVSGQDPSYWSGFLPGLAIVGIGMTISVAPLTTTVFDSAPEERSGVASGVNNAAARAGGLLAVAALGLAFGPLASGLGASALPDAYRLVMFGAAALAVLSALAAVVTISPRQQA